jgi:hypothetical protein
LAVGWWRSIRLWKSSNVSITDKSLVWNTDCGELGSRNLLPVRPPCTGRSTHGKSEVPTHARTSPPR